jgi:hypothetical protein
MAKAYAEVYQEVVSDYHDTDTAAGFRQDHVLQSVAPDDMAAQDIHAKRHSSQ